MDYLQPGVIIPFLVFAIALGSWWIYKKYFKKGKGIKGEPDKGEPEITLDPINARVCDNILGNVYDTEIPGTEVVKIIKEYKTLGRIWDRYGKKVYGLNRFVDEKTGEIKYKPLPIPEGINNSPMALHDDIQHPEVELIYGEMLKDDKTFAQKWGKLIWWIAVIGFIIAIMVNGR